MEAEINSIYENILDIQSDSSNMLNERNNLIAEINVALSNLVNASNNAVQVTKAKKFIKDRMKEVNAFRKANEKELLDDFSKEGTIEEIVANYKEIHSRSKLTVEDFQQKINTLSLEIQESEIKTQLLIGYSKIMQVRSLLGHSDIKYGIFIIGNDSSGQKQINLATLTLEQILSSTSASMHGLNLQLALSGAEIKQILDNQIFAKTQTEQFIKNEPDSEEFLLWSSLENIKNSIKNQKLGSYNTGNLIEAFQYLQTSGANIESIQVSDVLTALEQGLNTVPFYSSGDFILDGQDLQAKVLSNDGHSDESLSYITLARIPAIINQLQRILSALQTKNNKTVRQNLKEVFDSNGGERHFKDSARESIEAIIEKELEKIKQELKNSS